jgi:hypothetical protein
MKGRGLVPALAGLLAGCTVNVPRPDALMAGGDEALLSELRRGREIYVDKCSGCHSLHPVDAFDDARWKAEVLEMSAAKKIRLAESERDTLLRYLTTANGR